MRISVPPIELKKIGLDMLRFVQDERLGSAVPSKPGRQFNLDLFAWATPNCFGLVWEIDCHDSPAFAERHVQRIRVPH